MSKGPDKIESTNEPWAPLQPFLIGNNVPPWLTGDPGINFNALDATNTIANTGMPGNMPPMFMNNPMMTMQNVHTPYEGGPWGYGLGPGKPTVEAGIPNAPGPMFVQPPAEGFTPGPSNPIPQPGGDGTDGNLISPALLEQAQNYQKWHGLWNMGDTDSFYQKPSDLSALQWAMNNPDLGYADAARQHWKNPNKYR